MKKKRFDSSSSAAFFVCVLIMFAAFGIMMAKRFSTDGFSDYFLCENGTNALWKLMLGRAGGAAIEMIAHFLGVNLVAVQWPFTLLLIVVMAWACYDLWKIIVSVFGNTDIRFGAMVLLIILPAFINISSGEFFFFSDCALHWTGMLLLAQSALRCFAEGKKLLSLLLLILSISIYQAGIGYFVVWGVLIALLRGNLQDNKETYRGLGSVLGIGMTACAVVVGCQKVLELTGLVSGTERSPEVHTLFRNALYLLTTGQKQVLIEGMHFLRWTMLVFTLLLTSCLFLLCFIKEKTSTLLVIIMSIVAYAIPYAPHLITGTIWLAPRTIFSVFSYLPFCGILIVFIITDGGLHEERMKNIFTVCISALLFLFVLINFAGIHTIGVEQIKNNVSDRIQAEVLLDRVYDYENESGETVTKVAMVYDGTTTWSNPEVDNPYMDINIRSFTKDWEIIAILSYYGDREFQLVDVPHEVYEAYFAGKEWDSFKPDEQAVLLGDTLYLGVY